MYVVGGLRARFSTIRNYIEVLKPRESDLLTFIGVSAAFIAGKGQPPLNTLLLAAVTILIASGGANGLTNYLDRDFDAKMRRTRHRALPSGRIHPPQKALPLITGLIIAGLALAWRLHPFAFAADAVGTLMAATWRKRMTCVFPQGAVAGCAPLLMGWFAIEPAFDWRLLLLCLLIFAWLPLHVWSVMVSNRDDYLGAGLGFFPMNVEVKKTVTVILLFSLALYVVSVALYFAGDFGWLYLLLANLLGMMMVYASWRLMLSNTSRDAWRLYKLSSFPYLGLIFLVMCLDLWLL
jgi:protoheme IX farnesyltransferase